MSGSVRQDAREAAVPLIDCDAYLFDIDGTLLNSRDGVHYHAFHNAVRDVFGVDSHIDGVPVHGNTDIGILRAVVRRAGLSDAEFETRLPLVVEHMRDEVTRNQAGLRPELCPSILDLLQTLQRARKLMGIVSGNLETVGWLKLRAAGVADYFSFGSFSDRTELRADIFRNGIRQAQRLVSGIPSVCVIGDTPADIKAAREVGIPVIAVATGIFNVDQLRQHQPDTCVSCCTELLPHL